MAAFQKIAQVTELHARALPEELALWPESKLGAGGARPGLSAGHGAWPEAAAGARDEALRALAHRFYPCVPVSTQAARIRVLAKTYAFVHWPRDRECRRIPARYRGAPSEYLWAAFKSGAPMPLPTRDLRRILIGGADEVARGQQIAE